MDTLQAPPTAVPRRKPLLPDSAKKPLLLLWASVLPQFVLLFINLRAFWIVVGECKPEQKGMFYRLFVFEIVMIVGAAWMAFYFHTRRKFLPWKANWVLLIVPIVYLWLFISQMADDLIPRSVAEWILPPQELLYLQFSLVMPVIFYATVRLACRDIQISPSREVIVVLGAVFGPPLLCAVLVEVLGRLGEMLMIPFMIAVVFSGVVLVAGVTRGCVSGYFAIRNRGAGSLGILTFVVGVLGPVAGLCLNSRIPFPADFQSWPVYVMAVVNGCLLMLPEFEAPGVRRAVWFLQCAFFPFTLYFFLIFLPFAPLFIPAMVVLGSGFLILTPIILFFIHGQRILDGYQYELDGGSRLKPAVLVVLALAILPAITVTQAVIDRVVLRQAMDYIFSPDYRQPDRFHGSPSVVQRSLERLRDFKAGAYRPYLSDFYNWAVFGNLVLPDDKMSQMSLAFLGRDLGPATDSSFSLLGESSFRTRAQGQRRRVIEPAPSDVALSELTAKSAPEGDCERTTLTLNLHNNGANQGEYVTNIHVPDGVFVSGFWLYIGKERVPGKLFEKKTALWVYEKIRQENSNRDPCILVYSAPNTMELRIFPFAVNETRQVEIEFYYPASLLPTISVGDRQWRKEGSGKGICLTQTTDGRSAVSLSPEVLATLPPTHRVPYLHFIVDRSATSKLTDAQLLAAIRHTATHFTDAKGCEVTLANYESSDLTNGPVPIDSVEVGMFQRSGLIPKRGGFLAERAIKRTLLAYHDRLARAKPEAPELSTYPVVIILGDLPTGFNASHDLPVFGAFSPDTAGFFTTRDGETLASYDFTGKPKAGQDAIQPRPVALMKVGESVSPCALGAEEPQTVQFEASKSQASVSVLEQGQFRPVEGTTILSAESPYGKGVQALQRYLDWVTNPSLGNNGLARVVALSRSSGILVAATSYIVVENSAQWKILQLKQNQKLSNQVALEFEETPEPGTWLLLIAGGALLYWHRRRATRCSGSL